jgi:hypothetical protein
MDVIVLIATEAIWRKSRQRTTTEAIMAKQQAAEATTETTAATTSTGRSVILKLDAEHAALVGVAEGSEMKRTDYIRARWQAGVDRGPITKELNKIAKAQDPNAKDIPYQIVFQATKGLEGGSKKSEGGEAASTESSGDAA